MRFMYIVTSPQPHVGPTPELLQAMHKLADREIKAGRMLDNGGLMPLATGARVHVADNKLSVIDGPFVVAAGQHERVRQQPKPAWLLLRGGLAVVPGLAARSADLVRT